MKRPAALAVAVAIACVLAAGATGTSRQYRVAYVADIPAQPSPHDLRGAALLGFQRAVKNLPVAARVVAFSPVPGGVEHTLTLLARQRYDLVVIEDVLDYAGLVAAAKRFPGTKFVLGDTAIPKNSPKNVQGSIWHVEQPSYLAGYLAALMEKRRPGADVVGSVGGFPAPQVDPFIAGFEAGAKAADPGITTLRSYAYDFLNPEKCTSVALSQIARGAGAVLNVAGMCGLGTMAAAKEKGVWGIGVDVDQSFLGPHVLTSVLKRFDVHVYDTVRALVRGRLRTGGNAVWDVRNGAVGLGKISPSVPRSFVRKLEEVRRQIAAGAIEVPSTLTP